MAELDPALPEENHDSGTLDAEPISEEEWLLVISKWQQRHLYGSPIAQNTEAWNHLVKSLPHLRDLINQEL